MGEAFLVRFASAPLAVQSALDIQHELSLHNVERDEAERIVVRIGIHTGEVLTLDGDILGNTVTLAARIEPMPKAGGICLSADTYESVKSSRSRSPAWASGASRTSTESRSFKVRRAPEDRVYWTTGSLAVGGRS